MTIGIGHPGVPYTATVQAEPQRPRFAPGAPVDPLATLPEVDRVELSESVPPPELRGEIEFAFERAAELAARNRELHFAKDEDSGRVVVQVRDLDGNVIRTIPNAEALDVMAGADLA